MEKSANGQVTEKEIQFPFKRDKMLILPHEKNQDYHELRFFSYQIDKDHDVGRCNLVRVWGDRHCHTLLVSVN